MTHALAELLRLAISELHTVPNVNLRVQLMEEAGRLFAEADYLDRAERLREAAAALLQAHHTQLALEELFSTPTPAPDA